MWLPQGRASDAAIGGAPSPVDVTRAMLDVLERGNARVYREDAGPAEVRLCSRFRRHARAVQWAGEGERDADGLASRNLSALDG